MNFPGLILQLILLLLLAPLVSGCIKNWKAKLQNRRGPPIWQPYFDVIKFLRKDMVISEHVSSVFSFAPYVVFLTSLVVGLMVPMVTAQAPLSLFGGALAVVGLLALGRFFLALGGLEPASAFGGMGSSREVAVAALAEPTVMVAVFALALRANTTNLGAIVERVSAEPLLAVNAGHLLAFVAFFIVMLAETGRLPVDNPATHLELTMIHEAMVLEYSGRHLAMIEWASAMKLLVFLTLAAVLGVVTRVSRLYRTFQAPTTTAQSKPMSQERIGSLRGGWSSWASPAGPSRR